MHWCQEQAITYEWIAKAVEDGFLCQRQLYHCLRSKVMIKTQVYVPVYLYMKTVFAVLKASSLSFLLEIICSSSNASCLQTSICGSKYLNDENLESYMGMESKALNLGLDVRSCIGHAISPVVLL